MTDPKYIPLRALSNTGKYLDEAFHATQEAQTSVKDEASARKLSELRSKIRAIRQEVYGIAQDIQAGD